MNIIRCSCAPYNSNNLGNNMEYEYFESIDSVFEGMEINYFASGTSSRVMLM